MRGQDAGHDGDGDAFFGEVIAEGIKVGVVEEELGDDEVRAAINLGLEPVPVHLAAFFASDVALGETSGADAEAAEFAEVADELVGELEAAFGGFKFATGGRVAAQGEDVLDAALGGFGEDGGKLFLRRVDAGEVHHGGESVLALDAVHDVDGLVARAATCAVGHGAEVRAQLHQLGNVFLEKVLLALVGLRREKLERNDGVALRLFRRVNVSDKLHGASVARNGKRGKFAVREGIARNTKRASQLNRKDFLATDGTQMNHG